ncbi:hypothetical protein ISS39_05065 [Candidatus Bathyarchaeota archaeon]|nr:hypothetical protein [Candidatus Bathyarchaeota archaeon]
MDSENEVVEPKVDTDAEEGSDEPEYDYDAFLSIIKYLKVLVEAYPIPINQTEIAKRAGVSKALISKKRKLIQEFCDLKTMAYEKKYLIKEDDGINRELFLGSLLYDDFTFLQSLLKSEYLDSKISFSELYETLSDNFNEYKFDQYYTEEDVEWIYSYLKNRIINYDHNAQDIDYEDWIFTFIDHNIFGGSFIGWMILEKLYLLNEYVLDSDFSSFKNADFLKVLDIRNKSYYYTLDNIHIHQKICEKFINELNINDEKEYNSAIAGSKIISKYLLNYIFTSLTKRIYEIAENNGVALDEQYREITRSFEK